MTTVSLFDGGRPPLKTVESKASLLRERFLKHFPVIDYFPKTISTDETAISLRNLLGGPVERWLTEIKRVIGASEIIETKLAGSAALFCAGSSFQKNLIDTIDFLGKEELLKKLNKKEFPFSDIDIQLKVKKSVDLDKIRRSFLECKGITINHYNENTLILSIEKKLDIIIYKKLELKCSFYSDAFSIDVDKISYQSHYPKEWIRGQLFRLVENDGRLDYHLYLRLLGKLLKGSVCTTDLEDRLFSCWLSKIKELKESGRYNSVKALLDKQWREHDSKTPLSRFLLSLRVQQLAKDQFTLYGASEIDLNKNEIPYFLRFCFEAMKENIPAVHGALECIAYIALREGWEKPFEVKLVRHQGKKVMRMRFTGDFGKRDLLLNFDLKASLGAVKRGNNETIRKIFRSLSIDGISCREMSEEYAKALNAEGVNIASILSITKTLFGSEKRVPFSSQPSIASFEIGEYRTSEELLNVGHFVFDHYTYLREELCWSVVRKCLNESESLIKKLRESGKSPPEGYLNLFLQALKEPGSIDLFKVCTPFPSFSDENWALILKEKRSRKKILAKVLDEQGIDPQTFLKVFRLAELDLQTISERLLTGILQIDQKNGLKWFEKMDQSSFISNEYKEVVSESIVRQPHAWDLECLFQFLKAKRVFDHSSYRIASLFIGRPIGVINKIRLLETLESKDPALWHSVANECISRGKVLPDLFKTLTDIHSRTIVTCFELIEFPTPVEELLLKLQRIENQLNEKLKRSMLVRLLKNWDLKKTDVRILEFFNKEIPWNEFHLKAKTGKDWFHFLRKFPHLYSSLFHAIEPKEECFHNWWVQNAAAGFDIKDPETKDCFLLIKQKAFPLLERLIDTEDGLEFILEFFDVVPQDFVVKMLSTAKGVIAIRIYNKYPLDGKTKKQEGVKQILFNMVERLLLEEGDVKTVSEIWRSCENLPFPTRLPSFDALMGLLQEGFLDRISQMVLSHESPPLPIFSEILKRIEEPEKKAQFLQNCVTFTEDLVQEWEKLIQNNDLSFNTRLKLLEHGSKTQSAEKINVLIVKVFSNSFRKSKELDHPSKKFIISRMDPNHGGYPLWELVRKSSLIGTNALWKQGFNFLLINPQVGNEFFLPWMLEKALLKNKTINQMLLFIQRSPEDELCNQFKEWALKLGVKGNKDAQKMCEARYLVSFHRKGTVTSLEDEMRKFSSLNTIFNISDSIRGYPRVALMIFAIITSTLAMCNLIYQGSQKR